MFAPARLVYSLRPTASPGLLAAMLVTSTTFVATPFLLPEIVRSFDVGLGASGLISTAQVAGFALASFVAGRYGGASPVLLRAGLVVFVAANVASAVVPWFAALLAMRLLAGGVAGLITWAAWADAVGDPRRTADVSSIGPIGAIVGAPLFAWLVHPARDNGVFMVMAAAAVVAAALPMRVRPGTTPAQRRRISPSQSNRVLLLALALMTMAGSSLYIFAAAAAKELSGLSATAASGAFSLNALGGLVAARVARRPGRAWPWVGAIAVSIVAIVTVDSAFVFYAAMTVWGYAFWMALPRVLLLLAARSYAPAERIGDAHAGMAAGRAFGPAVGAGFAGGGHYLALGAVAAAGTALAAAAVGAVERFRRRGGDADVRPVAT